VRGIESRKEREKEEEATGESGASTWRTGLLFGLLNLDLSSSCLGGYALLECTER